MAKLFIIIFGVLGLFWPVSGRNIYSNHTLLRITPYNHQHLKVLRKLVDIEGVNVLKQSHGLNDTTDILASPRQWKVVERLTKLHGMNIKYRHRYGRHFDKGAVKLSQISNEYEAFKYNSYDAIQSHLQTLAEENPDIVKLETLCVSYEGRQMVLFKISANHEAKNPIIFLDAGAHAREWAAPALAMYIIDQLANAAKNLPDGADELLGLDWYILPVVNPDGYEFSRADPDNRMWRKTRSKTSKEECFGVDINRNYDYKWGHIGVSFDPCDFQTYAGRKPFSERETRQVRNVMWKYSRRIKLYLSIHSYGQYLVYPWGYTRAALPAQWKKLHRLAERYSKAVVEAGGQPFKVMSSGKWYPVSGASDDFAYGKVKIPYAYTLEITDGHEFIFPEKLLPTALPPFYEGFKVLADKIKNEFSNLEQRNRMWRKTRSKTWKKGCVGVDINRNYDYKWGYSGASFDPCQFETYAGRKPFSERETRQVRKVMWRYSRRIKLYLSIHSYGQYLVYPWGYTGDGLPPQWKKLQRLAEKYSKAVVEAGGQPFKVMSAGQWYPAAGASDDFAYGKVKIPYTYTLEITDGHEFIFPEKLLPTALPTFYKGFKVLADEIRYEFSNLAQREHNFFLNIRSSNINLKKHSVTKKSKKKKLTAKYDDC